MLMRGRWRSQFPKPLSLLSSRFASKGPPTRQNVNWLHFKNCPWTPSGLAVSCCGTREFSGSASLHQHPAVVAPRGSFTPTCSSPSTSSSFSSPPVSTSPKPQRDDTRITSNMTATKIDGTAIAKAIRARLRSEIEETQKTDPSYKPSLKIIQVGDRPDSTTYVRMKLKAAQEANIDCELVQFPETIPQDDLLETLNRLNNDPSVHGILVQLPLPNTISENAITSAVSDEKDVDGFGTNNIGELAKRGGRPSFIPCTPKGVMVLLQETGIDLKGKHAVVLGRSNIVGSPVSYLLKDAHATVTVCHSHTVGIENIVKLADVLVAAIGVPNFVKGEWLKPGAVVIDVGTNSIEDSTKKSGWRLTGDVDFASASEVASFITPVPGGVGPMTVAMLLQNVVDSATAHSKKQKA
ncbi:hypothetical protein HYFRA_00009544 [Hymenoscyphus fraxineus]|uniref:Methenyltetrahydrofolate cyclohydrolase n=1 Tax=Hymenoscyphus fraxineus TaxID=746836 RepID=A0A9N9L0Q3_9HELO|nr:hypothetical protein HYFRA_00009544 [Hymenoscyphus fraxineus]